MFNQFSRPCEVYKYCPDIRTIKYGSLDDDGIPNRIGFDLLGWKGRRNNSPYTVWYSRSYVNVKYCPVFGYFVSYN